MKRIIKNLFKGKPHDGYKVLLARRGVRRSPLSPYPLSYRPQRWVTPPARFGPLAVCRTLDGAVWCAEHLLRTYRNSPHDGLALEIWRVKWYPWPFRLRRVWQTERHGGAAAWFWCPAPPDTARSESLTELVQVMDSTWFVAGSRTGLAAKVKLVSCVQRFDIAEEAQNG